MIIKQLYCNNCGDPHVKATNMLQLLIDISKCRRTKPLPVHIVTRMMNLIIESEKECCEIEI